MAIEIICDDCGNKYRVGDDKAGSRVRCKECGAKIEVPDDDFETETEARPRSSSKKRQKGGDGVPAGLIIGIGAVVAVAVIGLGLFFVLGGKKNDAVAQANPANALPNSNPGVPAAPMTNATPASTLPVSMPNSGNAGAGNGLPATPVANTPPANVLPGSGLPMSNPAPVNQVAPGVPVAQNLPATPMGKPAGNGGFAGFAGGADAAIDEPPPDNWHVKVDPTKIDYKVDPDKTINLKIPKGGDFKDVVYP
ncbi:MAG: hypothetical protein JWM11_6145, partial [Planctomycetaceae bacterium]|nr:hypothetical protein [Planctomycetaceae bacterium]